jgi:hypothetical protein
MARKNRDLLDTGIFVASVVAAVAAVCAAFFTGRQAWIARDTEERQLRAYLYIDHTSIAESEPGKFGTDLLIRSAGVTPAYKLELSATLEIGPYLLNDTKLDSFIQSATQTFDYAVIYGDKPIQQNIVRQFSPEAIKLLAGDSQRLYLHGRVAYLDIFDAARHYDFCFVFHPKRDLQGSERGCEKYNTPR